MTYKIVNCSFRSDGSGRLYGYKIPADWEPVIGQKMKVPDSRGTDGAWKSVTIMELDGVESPEVKFWVWGIELIPLDVEGVAAALPIDGAPAEPFARDTNPGGTPIGFDLAEQLRQRQPDAAPAMKPSPTRKVAAPPPSTAVKPGEDW